MTKKLPIIAQRLIKWAKKQGIDIEISREPDGWEVWINSGGCFDGETRGHVFENLKEANRFTRDSLIPCSKCPHEDCRYGVK